MPTKTSKYKSRHKQAERRSFFKIWKSFEYTRNYGLWDSIYFSYLVQILENERYSTCFSFKNTTYHETTEFTPIELNLKKNRKDH